MDDAHTTHSECAFFHHESHSVTRFQTQRPADSHKYGNLYLAAYGTDLHG